MSRLCALGMGLVVTPSRWGRSGSPGAQAGTAQAARLRPRNLICVLGGGGCPAGSSQCTGTARHSRKSLPGFSWEPGRGRKSFGARGRWQQVAPGALGGSALRGPGWRGPVKELPLLADTHTRPEGSPGRLGPHLPYFQPQGSWGQGPGARGLGLAATLPSRPPRPRGGSSQAALL